MNNADVSIFGIPVSRLDTGETLDRIFELAARNDHAPCRVLATLNVDFLTNAISAFSAAPREPELYGVLRRAPLVSADGMPVVLLSRLLGEPLPERVAGADLVPLIAGRAAKTGARLYFLGGVEENTRAAAEILIRRFPGLRIAGIDCPFVKLDGSPESAALDREIIARINAAKTDILLVGFGNPKQELWAGRHAAELHCPVAIGVGGTFNFISGNVKRAPVWMQKSGTEWIFRLIQEPGRLWKRYGVGLLKFNFLALQAIGTTLAARLLFRRKAELRETAPGVLGCVRTGYVDNELRLRTAAAHNAAGDAKKTLVFERIPAAVRWQLKAHRVWK